MASIILQLGSLPEEIIISIAENADTRAVLALSSTSKQFRRICYQPATFKNMILNYQLHYLSEIGTAEIQKYVEALSQLARLTVRHWAMLTDLEELLQLIIDPSFMQKEPPQNAYDVDCLKINNYKIIRMISIRQIEIISNNHPCLKHADFREALRSVLDHLDGKTIVNFPVLYPGSLGLLSVAWTLSGTKDVVRFSKSASVKISHYSSSRYWREPGVIGHILNSELSDLMISFSNMINNVRMQVQVHNPAEYTSPPTLSSIQFPESWKMKAVERLTLRDELTVPNAIEYLTSGTWTGYYTYTFSGSAAWLDRPMRDIKFEVTKDMSESVEVRAVNARDGIGRFDIFLGVSKRDGRFHGEKKYERNVRWEWYGMVTPFGAFASWGMDWHGGHIWLWKDS